MSLLRYFVPWSLLQVFCNVYITAILSCTGQHTPQNLFVSNLAQKLLEGRLFPLGNCSMLARVPFVESY